MTLKYQKKINMDNNTDLTQQGTLSFVIRRERNPHFSDQNSNIRFYDQVIGKIQIKIFKKGPTFQVIIVNPEYGVISINVNISNELNQDLFVAVTWDKKTAKLYFNGGLKAEGNVEKPVVGSYAQFNVSGLRVGSVTFGENLDIKILGRVLSVDGDNYHVDFTDSISDESVKDVVIPKNKFILK